MSARTLRGALLAVFLAGAALTGCGGGEAVDGADSGGGAAEAPAGPAQAQHGAPAARDGAEAAGSGGGTGRPPGQQVVLAPENRLVVHQATLRVRADDVEQAAARAKQLVAAAGGYVQHESSSGSARRADLTFKIPADRYTATLDRLAGELGTKLSLRQQAEDVTEQVADVDSRVRSAEATLDSFRKLLRRANTVGEVIDVEREIATRQADLEALQARQKSLRERTAHATVTLELVAPSPADREQDEGPGGFLGGLRTGWSGLVAVASGAAVLAGLLLPFVPVAAVVAVAVLGVRRMRRARRPAG